MRRIEYDCLQSSRRDLKLPPFDWLSADDSEMILNTSLKGFISTACAAILEGQPLFADAGVEYAARHLNHGNDLVHVKVRLLKHQTPSYLHQTESALFPKPDDSCEEFTFTRVLFSGSPNVKATQGYVSDQNGKLYQKRTVENP